MTGLDAILHHNGFAMAAVGITIVFTALVTLSLVISQLHKLLLVWDDRRIYVEKVRNLFSSARPTEARPPQVDEEIFEIHYFDDINESSRQFQILIQAMGEPFSLPELIQIAQSFGIEHAHSTVSHLIVKNFIVPDGNGFYRWNQDALSEHSKRR
ncbi:MAG TPA: OadG family protein [Desulfosalsimonadaceae bacterium]|nr:OadG family protein [Desulfosalsimonadaceae bacterium]